MMQASPFIPPAPLDTAVLFLVFNRLDTTTQVFEAIRQAKPPRLYVAADGARSSKEGEERKVQEVRDCIMKNIDWECQVYTLFRDHNLGCKHAVSSAITWFFEHEEKGIILEDDCLPSQSFFWYCEQLLDKYKNTDDVYIISGDGRVTEKVGMLSDYDYTKYPMIWGWASWARVWKSYDVNISDWPRMKNKLKTSINNGSSWRYWENAFSGVYSKKIDTWDYQLAYHLLKNEAKCIVPRVNMISNIGFGEEATHTFDEKSCSANYPSKELSIPVEKFPTDNNSMKRNIDEYYEEHEFFIEFLSIGALKIILKNIFRF